MIWWEFFPRFLPEIHRSYLCAALITSSGAMGGKCLIYLIRYQLLCPTNILSFSSFSSKCWLWLCESAGRITRGCAQSLRPGSAETECFLTVPFTANNPTILRLAQGLQLIMSNQVFIFRHVAGFTYGITEQWKMSFVEIFFPFYEISLSQDVKWDYIKYSINQRD